MTTLARPGKPPPPATSRRRRAARTVAAALRAGVLASAVGALAWLVAGAIAATAFVALLLVSVAAALYQLLGRGISWTLWVALGAAWAVVLIERWAVQDHGGLWVAGAAWIAVIVAARRAGISRWSLPLLAYPLLSVAIAAAAGQSLLSPGGSSWLWVAAVLGPLIGARTVLRPSEAAPAERSPR